MLITLWGYSKGDFFIYKEISGRNMKILLVLTGGTICSAKNANGLNALSTESASLELVTTYRQQVALKANASEEVEFETISPINTLSENMTIAKWNILLDALSEVDLTQYAGVMILHGTDTLHLTAALMGVVFRDAGCPVMMVSAHRILSDPESNGPDNFAKSVSFISELSVRGMGGVFVIYRNVDGTSFVHHATHLEECADYSEDFFSHDMIEYDKLTSDWSDEWFARANADKQMLDRGNIDLSKGIPELKDDVLYIRPYVGINYDRINLEGVRAVLHGMYHSSTLNTEGDGASSAMSLLRRCNEAGIAFYIFPCKDGDYRYSTTKPLIDEGARCIYGMTWEEAYIRLLTQK